MEAPKYMVKVVVAKAQLLKTAQLAEVMGKSARSVRRYAQYGQLKSFTKTHRTGWVFVVKTKVAVG